LETQRLSFEPIPERIKRYLNGSMWKSRSPEHRQHKVDLIQTIATHIVADNAFVAFHYDGDRRWSERPSENVEKFRLEIRDKVKLLLTQKKGQQAADLASQRLLEIAPYYCVESWTYQNSVEARKILHERNAAQKEHNLLTEWETDPKILDEVLTPWAELASLNKRHNVRLLSIAFPADKLERADMSYSACLWQLLMTNSLVNALSKACRDRSDD
jgi:hypothetical protein